MLRGLINTVLWFCAPTPGGYLHALIYKRIQKPLQALKGYFLGHFSLPLNLLLKQLLHSLSKPEQQRCSSARAAQAEASPFSGHESISQTYPGEESTSPQCSSPRSTEDAQQLTGLFGLT